MQALGHYVDIMKIRNEIPLHLEVDLDPETEGLILPKLILPIVENAIVHGLVDHQTPRIEIRSRSNPDGIRIEIINNGFGADEDMLLCLNRRLERPSGEQDGAYERVGLMNVIQRLRLTFGQEASLTLANLPQGGMSVSLYLPQSHHHGFTGGRGRMMYRVMLIDDDVPMLKVLQQMIDWEANNLQIAGSTYSSAKAMHMFEEVRPDIVITDIGLPQNGIELADHFIRMKPEVRIIFLTCHEDFHYAQQAVKLQADDYLIKDQLTAEQLEQSLGKSMHLLKTRAGLINREARVTIASSFGRISQKVINGSPSEATLAYAAQIGISWTYPWFMLGLVSIQFSSFDKRFRQSEFPLILYAVYNIAMELSESYEGITPFMEQGNIVILHNFRVNLAQNASLHLQNYLRGALSVRPFSQNSTERNRGYGQNGIKLDWLHLSEILHDKCEFYENSDYTISEISQIRSRWFQAAPQGFLDSYVSELERKLIKQDLDGIRTTLHKIASTAKSCRLIRPTLPGIFPPCARYRADVLQSQIR